MNVEFQKELEQLINKHSIDNECQTPDFILAESVCGYLCVFRDGVKRRETWHGREPNQQQELFEFQPTKSAGS